MQAYLALIEQGKVTPSSLVDSIFPVDDAAKAYETLQKGGSDGPRPLAILLSYPQREDEATVRSFVVRCLRDSGFDVTEVAGGEPALRLVQAGSMAFDLVICDVAMPNMSGPEVRQHLLERDVRLPFLFTSGFSDKNNRLLKIQDQCANP